MLALVLCLAYGSAPESLVEEHVDSIAVVHIKNGAELVFFFDFIQSEWTCVDHRWLAGDMTCNWTDDEWSLFWHDDGDDCWRLITANHWLESWEIDNPLFEQQNRPWFARLLLPGLKRPGRTPTP